MPVDQRNLNSNEFGGQTPSRVGEGRATQQSSSTTRQLTERKTPDLVQFDSRGVAATGYLVKMSAVDIQQKDGKGGTTGKTSRTIAYILRDDTGVSVKVHGTYDINQKLSQSDLGKWVEIVYLGENQQAGRQGNAMKEFKVSVDESSKNSHGVIVTDEDIPF